jgi:hypothetical protein
MPAVFSHEHVRDLAKRLGKRLGREIKLTEIYEDMAAVFVQRPDAFMHKLKHEGMPPGSKEPSKAARLADAYEFFPSETTFADSVQEEAGFVYWLVTARGSMGGGLYVLVTAEGGNPHDVHPDKPLWIAKLVYRDLVTMHFIEGKQTSKTTLREAIEMSAAFHDGHQELFRTLYRETLDRGRSIEQANFEEAKTMVLKAFDE